MAEKQESWKAANEERMILLIAKLLVEEKLITVDEQSEIFHLVKNNDH